MTPENFCYWLQGYLDKSFTQPEFDKIKLTISKIVSDVKLGKGGPPAGGGGIRGGGCQTQPSYGGAGGVDASYGKPSSGGSTTCCHTAFQKSTKELEEMKAIMSSFSESVAKIAVLGERWETDGLPTTRGY